MGYSSIKYKNVSIPRCPNRCFEAIIDAGIEKYTAGSVEPQILSEDIGRTNFDFRSYIPRLGRHREQCRGERAAAYWDYCPHCGAKRLERDTL